MNLLFVIHNWVGYAPHGGTEVHAITLVEALAQTETNQVYVLFPDTTAASDCNNYILFNIKNKTFKQINLSYPVTSNCYSHQEFFAKFEFILLQQKIDIVHIFHLIRFPLNTPLIAKKAGAKVIISLFDYYLICQQFNLLKKNKIFCNYPNITIPTCDLCLKQNFNSQVGTQNTRRNTISQILYYTDAVHYLCQDQYNRFIIAYPYLQDKVNLIMGLGTGAFFTEQDIPNKLNNFALPLKVACVGNFDTNKGAELIIQIIDYYQSTQQNIQFHIYGDVRYPYSDILPSANKNVKVYGQYTPEELPNLLQQCHVALFASIWPETFVLALSEVWSCGLIPVAPNIGAFRERITHGQNGFLYELTDSGSIITILDNFLKMTTKSFLNLLKQVSQVKYPSLESNINQYLSLYTHIQNTKCELNTLELLSRVIIEEHHIETHCIETHHTETHHIETHPEIQQLPNPEQPIPPISENKHILNKAWQYYKQQGLLSTIKRSVNYTWQRIQKIQKI